MRISPEIITGTITGGNYSSGSYYYVRTGAKVIATWGVVTVSYCANFEGSPQSGKIHSVYDYGIITAGGTYNFGDLSITRSDATCSSPAEARLFFDATVTGGFGQATFYLRLYVPKGSGAYAKLAVLN